MGKSEWILVAVMLAIAFAAMLSGGGLEGSQLGLLLAGEPLRPIDQLSGTMQVVSAITLLATVVLFLSFMAPGSREFLRTGAVVLFIAGIVVAVYDSL